MRDPFPACNSSVGSLIRPWSRMDGPLARRRTFFTLFPLTMNPPMSKLSPVNTFARVEILSNCAGVAVAVGEAVADGVGVGLAVALAVGVAVAVAAAVA